MPVPKFIRGNRVDTERFVLTSTNIITKQIVLPTQPSEPRNVILAIVGGSVASYDTDFFVLNSTLIWASRGLDGLLETGDEIIVIYNRG